MRGLHTIFQKVRSEPRTRIAAHKLPRPLCRHLSGIDNVTVDKIHFGMIRKAAAYSLGYIVRRKSVAAMNKTNNATRGTTPALMSCAVYSGGSLVVDFQRAVDMPQSVVMLP